MAFEAGDYGEAIRAWKAAARSGMDGPLKRALAEAHFRRALASAANPARAARDLEEASALAPDHAIYHYHRGLAYHRQGQHRRAIAPYEQAHLLAPDDARIRRHLVLALLGSESDQAALERARGLLDEARGSDAESARLKALALLRQNEPGRALASLAGAVGDGAGRRPVKPLAILALGVAHLAAGHVGEAEASLGRVLRSRQDLPEEARLIARAALAAARLRRGDVDGAAKALADQRVPTDAFVRRIFGQIRRGQALALLLQNRLDDAILALRRALALSPEDEELERGVAHLLEVAGTRAARAADLGVAARHWEAALVYQPRNPRLLQNLALAEERLERWSSAGAHWEDLIRLWRKERKPDQSAEDAIQARSRLAAAYRHLATCYEAEDDVAAAARALDLALSSGSAELLGSADSAEVIDLRLRAAELFLEIEQANKAIEHLRRVAAVRPNDVRVLVDLGTAYELKRDDRQAQSHLEQARSLEPSNPAVLGAFASFHHERAHRLTKPSELERAVAEFQAAIALEPSNPAHYRCLGDSLLKLKRVDDADAAFGRVLELAPEDYANMLAIGDAYLEHGHGERAERMFEQALRHESGSMMRLSIGVLYLRQGRLDEAQAQFKHVLESDHARGGIPGLGSAAESLIIVGNALVKYKHPAEAIPYLERAIALDPSSFEAHMSLAYACAVGLGDHSRASDELAKAERIALTSGDEDDVEAVEIARETNELMEIEKRLGLGKRR